MSHHEAVGTTFWGVAFGAVCFGMAKAFRGPDAGASKTAIILCNFTGLASIAWAGVGFTNLLVAQPTEAAGTYQCAVDADHHVVVTIQNMGQSVLMVGSLDVQLEDATGKPQGTPANAFLPAILKAPKHFAPGETRTFDVGSMTKAGQSEPARCKITGASIKGGNGRGAIISFW